MIGNCRWPNEQTIASDYLEYLISYILLLTNDANSFKFGIIRKLL